jgi:hypothetical protein
LEEKNMANIEILGYFPKVPMEAFLFFCVNGVPDGHGSWLPDADGRLQTGVFFWLYSRNVPEAHFYNSVSDPGPIFGAAVQRLEPAPVPWMDNIPGFKHLLVVDGELGAALSLPPVNSPLSTLLNNKDLDVKFEHGRVNVEAIIVSLNNDSSKNWTFSADAFRTALRGDRGTDIRSMLAEIDNKLSMSIF